jgi:hypothetical protein
VSKSNTDSDEAPWPRPPAASLSEAKGLIEQEAAEALARAKKKRPRLSRKDIEELKLSWARLGEPVTRAAVKVRHVRAETTHHGPKAASPKRTARVEWALLARERHLAQLRDELDPGSAGDAASPAIRKRILRRIRALAERAVGVGPASERPGLEAIIWLSIQLLSGKVNGHAEAHRLVARLHGQAAGSPILLASIEAAMVDASLIADDTKASAAARESLRLLVPGAAPQDDRAFQQTLSDTLSALRLPDGRGRNGSGGKKRKALHKLFVRLSVQGGAYNDVPLKKALERGREMIRTRQAEAHKASVAKARKRDRLGD